MAAGDGEQPQAQPSGFPAAGLVFVEGEGLHPGGQVHGQWAELVRSSDEDSLGPSDQGFNSYGLCLVRSGPRCIYAGQHSAQLNRLFTNRIVGRLT